MQSQFSVDYPADEIDVRIARFSGWVQVLPGPANIEIRLNGTAQPFRLTNRDDVVGAGFPGAIGWEFFLETASLQTNDQRVISMDLLLNGAIIFKRNWRLKPAKPVSSNRLIFAMHMPKTAGSSLREALLGALGPETILEVYPSEGYVGWGDVLACSNSALDGYDLVYGHYAYGLHARTTRPYTYVSFLRRPFIHLQSTFFFKKYMQGHFAGLNIFEALETSNDTDFDNCYTRYFSNHFGPESVTEAHLTVALENIERDFSLVGTMEYMDASIDRLNALLGTNLDLPVLNVTPDVQERRYLDVSRFRQEGKSHIQFDLRLYDFVLERFWGASDTVGTSLADAKSRAG